MKGLIALKNEISYYKLAIKAFEKHVSENCFLCRNILKLIDLAKVRALADLSPSMTFIIDVVTKKFLYVSNSTLSALGYTPEEFYNDDLFKTLKIFPANQMQVFVEKILPTLLMSFERYRQGSEIEDIKFTYSIKLNHKDGSQRWFHHQVTVISRDDHNNARILLIQMTDIHQFKNDENITLVIDRKDKKGVYVNIMKRSFLSQDQNNILSEREVEVLNLLGQGLTSKEIAGKLFVSEHTIYKHRKNMLKKLNIKRSGDLLKKAIEAGIV